MNRRFRHGLVLGKFYPPHAGHHLLVDIAAGQCDVVTLLVCASDVESIPLELRAGWMREMHPQPNVRIVTAVDNVPIDYDDPGIWEAHMAVFRSAIPSGAGIDAVFTSEAYGDELARRFHAEHIPVDRERNRQPVSGALIRRDPVACWSFLSPPVRAYLTRRIVVAGAESTGTTTMARALAEHYCSRGGVWRATRWVPEWARGYCARKFAAMCERAHAVGGPTPKIADMPWSSSEFTEVAVQQTAEEDAAARDGSPVLFCDTDALATSIWHERYLGSRSASVERIVAKTNHHLWLLTDHEGVPFEQDGTRDGEHVREWMSGRFQQELRARRLPYIILSGPHEARLEQAIAAVDSLLAAGWWFADPLLPRSV